MISVDLDKIVTAKGLQAHLSSILFDVEEKEKTYIITKQGKPQAAIVNVDYLMELTGQTKLPEMPEFKPNIQEEDAPPAADRSADKLTPTEIVSGSAPEAPQDGPPMNPDMPIAPPEPVAPVEPPSPPPATITDLEQFAATDATTPNTDPYAVIDEPPPTPAAPAAPVVQQYDQNGLPVPVVPGQPDPTETL